MDPDDLELEPLTNGTKARNPMQALVTGSSSVGRPVPTAGLGGLSSLHLPGASGDTEAQIRGSYLLGSPETTSNLYASIYKRSKRCFVGCTMLVLSIAVTALVLSIVFWEKRPIDLNGPIVDLSLDSNHRWYIGPTGDYFKISSDPTMASSFLAIHKDGNVGLSDDSPTMPLSIVDDITAAIKMRVVSGATDWYVGAISEGGGSPPSDFFQIGSDATLETGDITIDPQGRVGINTVPSSQFHVGGTVDSSIATVTRIAPTQTATGTGTYNALGVYPTYTAVNGGGTITAEDISPTLNFPAGATTTTAGLTILGVSGATVSVPANSAATLTGASCVRSSGPTFSMDTNSTMTIPTLINANIRLPVGVSGAGITDRTARITITDLYNMIILGPVASPTTFNATNIYSLAVNQPSGASNNNYAILVGGTAARIQLQAGTSNMIVWTSVGSAAPTVSTRSAGTKIVLWESLSSTAVDHAIGVQSSATWFSVPSSSASYLFYANTTEVARLTGTGAWLWANTGGIDVPTFNTRSTGTRLVLFPQVSSNTVDYGLGIESNHMWFSTASASTGFKWYTATTEIARLNGAGGLGLGVAPSTGNGLVVSVPSTGTGTIENVIFQSSMNYGANSQQLRGFRLRFTYNLDSTANRTGLVADPNIHFNIGVAPANIGTTISRWSTIRLVGTDWTLNTGSSTTITTLEGMRIENAIGTITGTGALIIGTKTGLNIPAAPASGTTVTSYYGAYIASSSTAATTNNVGLVVESPGGSAPTTYAAMFYGGSATVAAQVLIANPQANGNAALRIWSQFDGTPGSQNGYSILQFGGKSDPSVLTPDNCWYMGLDGTTGSAFAPDFRIGFGATSWAAFGATDKFWFTAAGSLGVGISPTSRLHVYQAISNQQSDFSNALFYLDTRTTAGNPIAFTHVNVDVYTYKAHVSGSQPLFSNLVGTRSTVDSNWGPTSNIYAYQAIGKSTLAFSSAAVFYGYHVTASSVTNANGMTVYGFYAANTTLLGGGVTYGVYVESGYTYGGVFLSPVGVGAAAPTAMLHVTATRTSTVAADVIGGIRLDGVFTTGAASQFLIPLRQFMSPSIGHNVDTYRGISVECYPTLTASSTISNWIPIHLAQSSFAKGSGSSTITNWWAIHIEDQALATGAGALTIASKIGLRIRSQTSSGHNTTTWAGIQVDATTSAATNYAALLNGAVGVGTLTPTDQLQVSGGHVSIATAGNTLKVKSGTNACIGVSGAMTAGTITITTTCIRTGDYVFTTRATNGGTLGHVNVAPASIVDSTSFIILSSSNTETSTFFWWIVRPT